MTNAANLSSKGSLVNSSGQVPVATGVSGLGTGVATALAVNVGSAGAPVVNGGALGTPSSGTLTNCTFPTLNQNTTGTAAGLSATLAVASGGTGSTTLSANAVLLGNGTSALQTVAPSTSGNVLTSNGTTWVSSTPASGYAGAGGQVFTSSGTFTIPSGITKLKVIVTGGGGGGSGNNNNSPTCGGGGGGTAISYLTGLTAGNTLAVTIGAAGSAGGSGGSGGAGGNSTVASGTQTISTITGNGGSAGPVNSNGPAVGGSASGGSMNLTGGSGMGQESRGTLGTGGSSYWSPISQGGNNYTIAGITYGGGGSSTAIGGNCQNVAGGAGKAGIVVFEW